MEKAKILIVEDEAIIAMEIESQLQSLGYKVTSIVDTSEKAIEKAEKDKPDLILMDIRIKGEMDGIDTAESIRSQFSIPVIFSTAYLDQERIERAKITMPFGYVLKPMQERDLKVTLEMALYVAKVEGKRKRTEETLRFERNRAQQYLNVAGVLLIALDQNGIITTVNPKGCEILGYEEEEIIGHNWFDDFLPNEGIQNVKKVFKQIIAGEIEPVEYYENPIARRDGSQCFIAWHNSILRDNKGRIIGLFSSGEDITKRKETEKELEKASVMIHSISDAVITTDVEGNITFWNKGAEKIYGYQESEVIGKSINFLYIEKDIRILNSLINELVEGRKIPSVEVTCIDNENNDVYILLSLTTIKDDEGNIIELVGFTKDISDRKRVEKKLKKAHEELEQKVVERTMALQHEIDERKQIEYDLLESRKEAEFANNAKSEFLSNISHEFRTPMHQILSYSKFGVDKIDKVTKEKLLHYFEKIGTIGKSLLSLLNDLLNLSKLESGKFDYDIQSVDLKKIIGKISNEFQSLIDDKGLSLKLTESDVPTEIICDEYKIGQVIRNFLSNAVKFTPKGKEITISYEFSAFANGQRKTETETIKAICVKVSDQGIGIPVEEIEDVFDKFIQSSKTKTNAGGTGLGLAICKEITKAHNGKIWAENNPEGGATFSFMLPYEQETAPK